MFLHHTTQYIIHTKYSYHGYHFPQSYGIGNHLPIN